MAPIAEDREQSGDFRDLHEMKGLAVQSGVPLPELSDSLAHFSCLHILSVSICLTGNALPTRLRESHAEAGRYI